MTTNKEFSLYEEEEKIISKANEFISLGGTDNFSELKIEYTLLLDNYKKLFKQTKRLIRMSDRMEAELAITKAELEKYSDQLKLQATTDTLTGLANRRKITGLLDEEIQKVKNTSKDNFSIVMLDIDFFKKVNDNFGHPMGDQVIKEVSNHMQDRIGTKGVVGRFGGEEFLTVLYVNDINAAGKVADQIRVDIENKKIEFDGKKINVTVSMGVACSSETVIYQDLLNKADERLYKAKENGRNQTVIS